MNQFRKHKEGSELAGNFLIQFFIMVFIFSSLVFPQEFKESEKTSPTLSRSRILVGYSSLLQKNRKPELSNYFVNYNYRSSSFNPFDKPLRLDLALEVGANFAYSVNNYDGTFAIIPYVKTGPELLITKNLMMGASFGFAPFFFGYLGVGFFGGLNSYYLIPTGKSEYIEFEGGFHSVLTTSEPSFLTYISVGIALR